MKIHHLLLKHYFQWQARAMRLDKANAVDNQWYALHDLVNKAQKTAFGKDHDFVSIKTYQDFKQRVPLRTYADIEPYIQRIFEGENDVLWQGKPLFFAKTSGTTSGVKYIPVTSDYIQSRQKGSQFAAANLSQIVGNLDFWGDKLLLFSENHTFQVKNGFRCAAISAIDSYLFPKWLDWLYVPGRVINQEPTYDKKIERTIEKMLRYDVRAMFGLPVWLMLFLDSFEKKTGKKFKEIYPQFSTIFLSGMNYTPYLSKLKAHLGENLTAFEAYVASEGFIAYQDRMNERGMVLVTKQGIFYEFMPLEDEHLPNPRRFSLAEIELDKDYALILNTNTGLWGYLLGDIVRFVSKEPYRIVVTGRLNQVLSAFGEHLLPIEAENALSHACFDTQATVTQFTVVPQIAPSVGLPHHEWYIEFEKESQDLTRFSQLIHEHLASKNMCYGDLVIGNAIAQPKIISLPCNFFASVAIQQHGTLNAQQKTPILQADRNWVKQFIK
ncbi:MAG: GH3 auxin-responsive promoter family protein [Saprospiraceae bacterium]|nr:GH3 auxin-responsive promoter family protein [Saprospiraceae bacterium]